MQAKQKISPAMLDDQGRITNQKRQPPKAKPKQPPVKGAPVPKQPKQPNAKPQPVPKTPVVQNPQPVQRQRAAPKTDAYGRLTNVNTPVWQQPGGLQQGLMKGINPPPRPPGQPQGGFGLQPFPQQGQMWAGGNPNFDESGRRGLTPEQIVQREFGSTQWTPEQKAARVAEYAQFQNQNGWGAAAVQPPGNKPQQQDWMSPTGEYKGAPGYKPTKVKTPKW